MTKVNEFEREVVAKLAYDAGYGMTDVRQNILKLEKFARLLEQYIRKQDDRDQ